MWIGYGWEIRARSVRRDKVQFMTVLTGTLNWVSLRKGLKLFLSRFYLDWSIPVRGGERLLRVLKTLCNNPADSKLKISNWFKLNCARQECDTKSTLCHIQTSQKMISSHMWNSSRHYLIHCQSSTFHNYLRLHLQGKSCSTLLCWLEM